MAAPILQFPQTAEPSQVDQLATYENTCSLMTSLICSFKAWVGTRHLNAKQLDNLKEEFLTQFYRIYCGKRAFGFTEPITKEMIAAAWKTLLPHIREFCS